MLPNTTKVLPPIVSYLTIVGWLVAVILMAGNPKTDFELYHYRQSLGLHLSIIAALIVFSFLPFLEAMTEMVFLLYILAILFGCLSAKDGKQVAVYGPLSDLFQTWFGALK